MLAAILIAGRSGSAITAQIGVMRVTEELDAMRVMGIPHSFRLVMPRAMALALAMPLISVWTTLAHWLAACWRPTCPWASRRSTFSMRCQRP
jgi:phospholipid/cholesterol/gamma-HCH transport system permease protein